MTAMTNQATPEDVLAQINEWEAAHPIVGDPGNAPNIWDDVIPNLDGYNDFATQVVDPKERGDRFVVQFHDRQVTYRLNRQGDGWYIYKNQPHTSTTPEHSTAAAQAQELIRAAFEARTARLKRAQGFVQVADTALREAEKELYGDRNHPVLGEVYEHIGDMLTMLSAADHDIASEVGR